LAWLELLWTAQLSAIKVLLPLNDTAPATALFRASKQIGVPSFFFIAVALALTVVSEIPSAEISVPGDLADALTVTTRSPIEVVDALACAPSRSVAEKIFFARVIRL